MVLINYNLGIDERESLRPQTPGGGERRQQGSLLLRVVYGDEGRGDHSSA